MSTAGGAVVTLLVLGAAGLLPVLTLVGLRLVAVPLCPLAGAVLAAASGACTIAVAGTLQTWFVVWSLAAAAVAALAMIRAPGRLRPGGRAILEGLRPVVAVAAVLVVVAAAWSLRTLSVPNIGFDTRAIWLLHAQWLSHGHALARADISNAFFVVSHPSYPPLMSSVMAFSWALTGNSGDRLAVVVVALLNGCALTVGGWGVVEVARQAIARTEADLRRRRLVVVLSGAVGALVVLVAGGVLGVFATNGYADPLWSLAAVGTVLFGLVLQPSRSDLGIVAILLAVAGLTKVEGTAVAVVLLLAVGARRVLGRRPSWSEVKRPAVAIGVGVLALLSWEFLTILLGIPTDPSISGRRDGSLISRAQGTWDGAVPHLHVVLVAGLCALFGLLLLRSVRERLGLGNDLWAWGALCVAIVVLGGAYIFGPGNLELWLATSVNRTTIVVALMAWWIVAGWAVVAGTAVLA